ncbi:hypothetical protein Y032_0074g850 [Ancylostoma ceylanicum]|uniref:Uncharacterized protein n=1 Tax=Ancylostoma ceylanicum TaxID=53326 RepID=A0A016TVQ0_9BILA|nr:hypothetical protein Y032_0074g850 [Ancylostoma ceylanicum]
MSFFYQSLKVNHRSKSTRTYKFVFLQPAAISAQEMLGSTPKVEQPVVVIQQDASDNKPPTEEPTPFHPENLDSKPPLQQAATLLEEEVFDVKPPVAEPALLLPVSESRLTVKQALALGPCVTNGIKLQSESFTATSLEQALGPIAPAPSELLCERIRRLNTEKLTIPLGTFDVVRSPTVDTASLGRRTKVVIRRVRQFFEELKKLLGDSCKGTVFDSPVEMTAMACGVSQATVRSLGVRSEFVHELFPRKKKKVVADPEALQETTLRKYGEEWGQIVRFFIKEKLKKENMTIAALHEMLHEAYADFPMSCTTLYRFTKALGVTYGRNRGISYMLL